MTDSTFLQQQTATDSLSLTVAAPLTILTLSLPQAQINQPYNVQLQASGGTPPYTWSILGGVLPPASNSMP